MPHSAPRPCTHPSCSKLVYKGSRCPDHPYEMKRTAQAQAWVKWYKTARWIKSRAAYLAKHPYCRTHATRNVTKKATVVDHVQPHKGNETIFWDQSNWQGLCKQCHDKKTASRDGGFGNKRRG